MLLAKQMVTDKSSLPEKAKYRDQTGGIGVWMVAPRLACKWQPHQGKPDYNKAAAKGGSEKKKKNKMILITKMKTRLPSSKQNKGSRS